MCKSLPALMRSGRRPPDLEPRGIDIWLRVVIISSVNRKKTGAGRERKEQNATDGLVYIPNGISPAARRRPSHQRAKQHTAVPRTA